MKILTALKLDGRYYNNKYLGLTKKKKTDNWKTGNTVSIFKPIAKSLPEHA